MHLPSESDRYAFPYNQRSPIDYPVYEGFDDKRGYSFGTEGSMPWPGHCNPEELEELENLHGFDTIQEEAITNTIDDGEFIVLSDSETDIE